AVMFPAFVMFRGGNLPEPAILIHSHVRHSRPDGKGYVDLSDDPIAILYHTLKRAPAASVDTSLAERVFEVPEFSGPGWLSLLDPKTGDPTQPVRFEDARRFSRIIVSKKGPPVWTNIWFPAPGYFWISEQGITILEELGLEIRGGPSL